eukprot:966336_1
MLSPSPYGHLLHAIYPCTCTISLSLFYFIILSYVSYSWWFLTLLSTTRLAMQFFSISFCASFIYICFSYSKWRRFNTWSILDRLYDNTACNSVNMREHNVLHRLDMNAWLIIRGKSQLR